MYMIVVYHKYNLKKKARDILAILWQQPSIFSSGMLAGLLVWCYFLSWKVELSESTEKESKRAKWLKRRAHPITISPKNSKYIFLISRRNTYIYLDR